MIAQLAKFELLRDMTPQELEQLGGFLEQRSFDDGRTLFAPGDEGTEMLFLTEGRIRLELDGQSLGELDSGATLGGASLVLIGKRACQALASGPIVVLALSRGDYLRLRSDHPRLALALQEAILSSLAATVWEALEESQDNALRSS